MEWSGQAATVGYNSNGDYYDNNPANGLSDIAQIISCVIPEGERRKRQIGQNGGQTSLLRSNMALTKSLDACKALARADNQSFTNINQLMQDNRQDFNRLPICPSTKALLDISSNFEVFTPQEGDCHRSLVMTNTRARNGNINFVTVCCYADNG